MFTKENFASALNQSPKDGKWYVFGTKTPMEKNKEKITYKINTNGIISYVSWNEVKNDWHFICAETHSKTHTSQGFIGQI